MARKLKTYITNLGFFELALAAPSMKAALEAWGMGHNAFHHGFARETDDPKIVAATMAKPGVVLRRPVGTTGAFAELPRNWKIAPPKTAPVKPVSKPPPRPPKPAKKARDDKKETAARAAIISFEKAKARRERERDKEAEREAAREEKERAQRTREAEKAEAALARAQARHEEVMASIEKDREKLDRRAKLENDRWNSERDELKEILRDAQG
jgi:colicin import membrane protein